MGAQEEIGPGALERPRWIIQTMMGTLNRAPLTATGRQAGSTPPSGTPGFGSCFYI